MMNAFGRFSAEFWFGSIDPRRFFAFRRAMGATMVLYFLLSFRLLHEGLTASGFHVPQSSMPYYGAAPFPLLPEGLFLPLFVLFLGSLAAVALSPRSRLAPMIAFGMLYYVSDADFIAFYTVQKLFLASLLVFSLASPPDETGRMFAWPERVLQITLITMYLGNGLGKLFSGDWLDHPELLRVMADGIYRSAFAARLLDSLPSAVWTELRWGVIAIELGMPFLLLLPRLRFAGLLLGLLLHVSIAVLMSGLWIFSLTVLDFYIVFLPAGVFRSEKTRRIKRRVAFLLIPFLSLVISPRPSGVLAATPDGGDAFLRFLPKQKRIVAIGEMPHGSEVLMEKSADIIRSLALGKDVSGIFLEENDSALEGIRRYLRSGCSEAPEKLVQSAHIREYWKRAPFQDLVRRLCLANAGTPGLGIDIRGIDGFEVEWAVRNLPMRERSGDFSTSLCLLDRIPDDSIAQAKEELEALYIEGSKADVSPLIRCRKRLENYGEENQENMTPEARRALRDLLFFYDHLRFWRTDRSAAYVARDRVMFENLAALLEGPYQAKNIVVWGHLAHLIKGPGDAQALHLGNPNLGVLLSERYGEKFWVIGEISAGATDGWVFEEKTLRALMLAGAKNPEMFFTSRSPALAAYPWKSDIDALTVNK